MAALDTIAPEAREGVARIGSADLVVAIPSYHNAELLTAALADLGPVLSALAPNRKTVLLHPDTAVVAQNGEEATINPLLYLLPYPLPVVESSRDQTLEQGLRSLMQVSRTLEARVCVMLGSEPTTNTPDDLHALAQPVLNHGYDLAVPVYVRRKFVSLINSSIIYPLTRALYGARLQFPMTVDLAISARLAGQELSSSSPASASGWITTRAICAGLQVCQVHREVPPAPANPESSDVSATLSPLLSRLFLELERTAGFWQKVRGSQPVRAFGQPQPAEYESSTVDVNPMVETFQRGCRDLLDIWGPVLSPATLVELRKIAKLPVDQFRIGDELWAHVLYEFILGHRQRVISREHLLRALTPIYLAWVASYALEVRDATPAEVESRLEKLCVSFENLKPYLLSRWRWPDRFNP